MAFRVYYLQKLNKMKNFKFKINGVAYDAQVDAKEDNQVEVVLNGKTYVVDVEAEATKQSSASRPVARPTASVARPAVAGGASKVVAPLPGNITKVLASEGQALKAGDVIMVMEAMKMENNITAEADCTITKIVAQVGQSVNQDDVLAEIAVAASATVAAAPTPAVAPKATPAPAAAPAPKPAAPSGTGKVVESPLPGTITKINVKPGDAVKVGDTLLVMEAMKMANDITAEWDGTVKAVLVSEGASVMNGDALVEIA